MKTKTAQHTLTTNIWLPNILFVEAVLNQTLGGLKLALCILCIILGLFRQKLRMNITGQIPTEGREQDTFVEQQNRAFITVAVTEVKKWGI